VSVEASNALTARWAAHLDGTSTVLSGASVYPLLALLAQAAHAPAPQAAMATFTADGFKAAAITALAMAAGSMPAHERRSRKLRVQVTFDRPFGFVAVAQANRPDPRGRLGRRTGGGQPSRHRSPVMGSARS
jgi:hypothetical protein